MPTLMKGQLIYNPVSRETGKFIAAWYNEFAAAWIVNVKVNGLTVSWNVLSMAVNHA